LGARSDSLQAAKVDGARLEERSIVLSWAMRGTLHLVAAEDHGWIVPLTMEPGIANAHRRLREEGVPSEQPERAVGLVERMLEREGPLTRSEIAERLESAGIHTAGQAIAHLVWLAAATGRVCHGPEKDGKPCFVLARDWLGKPKRVAREAALVELAQRYLAAHAPALPADFASWSGLRARDVRAGWSSLSDRLAEVATARGPLWTLRSRPRPAPPVLARLLPAFDEYLMGWKDRGVMVPAENWGAVNRGGGWVHPVLLFDGRLVATWRAVRRAKGLRVEVRPFTDLPAAARLGVEGAAAQVGAFLGTPTTLAILSPRPP
jgi:hypothetical protein